MNQKTKKKRKGENVKTPKMTHPSKIREEITLEKRENLLEGSRNWLGETKSGCPLKRTTRASGVRPVPFVLI